MQVDNFDEIIAKFIEDKRLEGRADGTLTEYRIRLEELKEFLIENNLAFSKLKSTDVTDFVRFLQSKRHKNQTIKNKLSTFRVLNKWMVKNGLIVKMVVTPDHYPQDTSVKRIRRLSDEELAIFKAHIDGLQENVRAAFYLMLGTGCRVGEAAHLRPADISLRGKRVYVDIHDAKWGSDRCIPIIDEKAAKIVWKYREEATIDNRPLFHVSKRTLQGYATDFAKKTGITFRCHLLRHTFAALLTEQGIPMTTTQYLLGHRSLSMTAHYAQSAIADISNVSVKI